MGTMIADARFGGSLLFVVLGVMVILAASMSGLADHEDGSDRTDFVVHTYGGSAADERQPGGTERSYWVEAYLEELPKGERMYLARSIFYRPVPTDCGASNIDVVGIDRNATYGGQRKVDENIVSSVESYDYDDDARDQYESRWAQYGSLRTTDWAYLERFEVEWYTPKDFGTPVDLYRGDRFVSAEKDCYTNPDEPGWYRFMYLNTYEFENGTVWEPEAPVFSHWYWICDCEDREEAVATLGPPPSAKSVERRTSEPAVEETAASEDGPSDAETSKTQSESPTPTDSEAGAAGGTTSTVSWEEIVVRTPSSSNNTGPATLIALLALVAVLITRRV